MVPLSLLRSTFHIRCNNATGTAFTLDYNGWEYIVTARHVVEDIFAGHAVEISFGDEWLALPVSLIGYGERGIDVAVLSIDFKIGPPASFPASTEGMVIGQQVYFLGFPLGIQGGSPDDHVFPYPLAKSGVLCGVDSWNNSSILYVDCHANRGFSGGPLFFFKPDNHDAHIAGVMIQYRIDQVRLGSGDQAVDVQVGNAGIGIALDIRHVVDIINGNPNRTNLLT